MQNDCVVGCQVKGCGGRHGRGHRTGDL
jgi:hypothetical protein